MNKETNVTAAPQNDEEVIDTLIAISVVAKRLARQLQTEKTTEVNPNGKDE